VIDMLACRQYARALARYACGGKAGRSKLDPLYVEVTHGRDFRANWEHYSSCGDLLHWHAEQMGVDEKWINRDRTDPPRHWEFLGTRGNIGKLQAPLGPAIATPISYLPEAGDYLLCWHDDGEGVHVRIAGNTEAGVLETFDYGAGGMTNTEHGASCNHLKLVTNGGKLFLETLPGVPHAIKRVQKVIPLPVIVALAGSRLPSMTGEEIDALEARVA
jgi:hypothetical protein